VIGHPTGCDPQSSGHRCSVNEPAGKIKDSRPR
jgi:hypothetical protein